MPELTIQVYLDGENCGSQTVELFDQDGVARELANLAELIQQERIKRLLAVEVG